MGSQDMFFVLDGDDPENPISLTQLRGGIDEEDIKKLQSLQIGESLDLEGGAWDMTTFTRLS